MKRTYTVIRTRRELHEALVTGCAVRLRPVRYYGRFFLARSKA